MSCPAGRVRDGGRGNRHRYGLRPAAADGDRLRGVGCAGHRLTGAVTALPGACRRLGPASLSQAVRIAVSQLSDHGDKADHAIWRAAPGIG